MSFRTVLPALLLAVALSLADATCRRVVPINPPTLFDPTPLGFSQISVDTHTRVAHIAGQVAVKSPSGAPVITGDTLEEQLVIVEANIRKAMAAVHATQRDILRVSAFMLDFTPADAPTYARFGSRLGSPVATFVGTPGRALSGMRAEVELDVAVPWWFARRIRCT